jgi:hypothetical protein
MSLKSVGSAGEENCLVIAVRLGCELAHLGLAILRRGMEVLLGDGGRLGGVGGLREREETDGDVMRLDGESRMSVIDSFGASCFRKKAFFCCNLRISA